MSYYVGQLYIVLAFFMLAPLTVAYFEHNTNALEAYTLAMAITLIFGVFLRFCSRFFKANIRSVGRKEAFGIVSLGWIGCGLLGGLPFLFEGVAPDISSSTFEAISGLTTTGASVFPAMEALSKASHLWRFTLHWVGGMGIVVLFVAIFPQLGLGGKHLFKSEVSNVASESIKPRIKQTATRLWWIYAFLTALCASLFFMAGMPLFDAVGHAFSVLSTGGFSTHSASIGYYNSATIEWICILFMWIGGTNFTLYYGLFRGDFRKIFNNIEIRVFVLMNIVVAFVIFLLTTDFKLTDLHDDFRTVLFQITSVSSTTGLMTTDYELYPSVAKYLMFLTMFVGGCAGSTAGGIKISRVVIVFKRCWQELRLTLHPQEVVSTKLGLQTLSRSVISAAFIFICTYAIIYLLGVFLMMLLGHGWVESTTSVVACLSSVGPGFGAVGPTQNYSVIHPAGKYLLSFLMIAGRLEIFVLLSLFTPNFWRKG